jgi:hypothetical protein
MSAMKPNAKNVGLAMTVVLVLFCPRLYGAQPNKLSGTKDASSKAAATDDKNVTWKLAGREGDCAPLSILAKRGAAYGDIKSPKELVDKLKVNGHQAEMKEFKAGIRPAVEVRAPSAGIHVMFVRQEHCDKKPPEIKK